MRVFGPPSYFAVLGDVAAMLLSYSFVFGYPVPSYSLLWVLSNKSTKPNKLTGASSRADICNFGEPYKTRPELPWACLLTTGSAH